MWWSAPAWPRLRSTLERVSVWEEHTAPQLHRRLSTNREHTSNAYWPHEAYLPERGCLNSTKTLQNRPRCGTIYLVYENSRCVKIAVVAQLQVEMNIAQMQFSTMLIQLLPLVEAPSDVHDYTGLELPEI